MVTERRFLSLTTEILMGPAEVVLELPQSTVGVAALELALLVSGLAESLRIRASTGRTILLTSVNRDRVARATVSRDQDGNVAFALGANQLNYLHVVLLRAYRDQTAEVNHVHLEGELEGDPYDLTIMFEVFREPLSAEQAEELMSDP